MLVSVVIPVYNSGSNILKALQSLMGQTYKNIEIIVILDGCTDDTLDWCKKCQVKDERIKIIEQENAGTYMARYNGIEKAKGQYIMFLDSDDYLDRDAIRLLVDLANKNNSDVIRFRYEKIEDGQVKYIQDEYFPNEKEVTLDKSEFREKLYPFFLEGYMVSSIWANFIKRGVIPKNNLERRVNFGEDLLFNLNCFNNINSITFISEPLYKYCTTEGSTTRTYNVKKLLQNLDDALYVYIKLYYYALQWNIDKESMNKLRIRIVYELSTIIDKLNKTGQDVNKDIARILNNEQYKELKDNIEKSKIEPTMKNYDLVMDMIDKEVYTANSL